MLRIGLTGGIGSGKSTVARIFEVLGVPVYYADVAAKRLMNADPLRRSIAVEFGESAYTHGELNRKYLAEIVFQNPDKLERLNALVHPATLLDAKQWLDKQKTPYAIKEAALIFESDAWKDLDYVIGVSAPVALRMQRVMERDALSQSAIEARMKKQMDESEKINRCDFILVNDESSLLVPQVLALHEKLLKLK